MTYPAPDPEPDTTQTRLAAYMAHCMPGAEALTITDFARIHGGASQEMFRFRARWTENDALIDRPMILRREAPGGMVEAERDLEYKIYRALAETGWPLPRAHFLELDSSWLDRPFFIMDMVPGNPGHFYIPGDPYQGHGAGVARQFWHHLGTLAALDHRALGLDSLRNGATTQDWWTGELWYWEHQMIENETVAEPVLRGALRHLRRNPPSAPMKPSVVHGDYRSGNFLFTPDGQISAILDWEMAHIGDPLEDVAWAIDPMWPMTRHLPLDESLAIWSAASGQTVDHAALDWWRLFSAFKASVLWLIAARSFSEGRSKEMVLAMSAIQAGHLHRTEILKMMAARGAMA